MQLTCGHHGPAIAPHTDDAIREASAKDPAQHHALLPTVANEAQLICAQLMCAVIGCGWSTSNRGHGGSSFKNHLSSVAKQEIYVICIVNTWGPYVCHGTEWPYEDL